MKKNGASMVLGLLVTVFLVFAARSLARTPDLGNFLLRSKNLEEDHQVAGLKDKCCDVCKYCTMDSCICTSGEPGSLQIVVPISWCSRKCSSNILVTGESLGPGERLASGNYFFEMECNCNLVLYNSLAGEEFWQSNTTITFEPNCTLSFDDYGRLCINSTVKGEHFTIFRFPKKKSERGDYIAVLRPEGKVAIYGPRVWAVPPQVEKMKKGDDRYESTESSLGNVLFSGQALQNGQELQSHNGHTRFILKYGRLALSYGGLVPWHSDLCVGWNTTSAPLTFQGQLFVFDTDSIKKPVCWASSPPRVNGEYVLAAQDDGKAAIYGPRVATIPELESSLEGIRMVTTE